MLITDTPFSSFEKISMNIVEPLPETTKGNSYILTIQDHLTKFSLAIPLKFITAIQVADALLKYFICIFGAPKIILTDQGTNFTSNLMKRFVFGKLARQPSSEITDDIKERTYDDYLYQLMTNIHDLQELARECLIASKVKSKYYYDKRINPQTFQISDQVFLLNEPKRGKLGDQYTGPHIITDILPNGNIKIFVKGKLKIVHPNKIRKTKRD